MTEPNRFGVALRGWRERADPTDFGLEVHLRRRVPGLSRAELSTTEGTITMVAAEEGLFLRLFTPAVGPDPITATTPYPSKGLSFLDGIAPIGNKFHSAGALGPESQPNVATGDYHRTIYFRFGA